MTDRTLIRGRALVKRVRPMLPDLARICFDSALETGNATDGRYAIDAIPENNAPLRALATVALFHAGAPKTAFQAAFLTAWYEHRRELTKFAAAEGGCLIDMFRYASFGVPERLPPLVTIYHGVRGTGQDLGARGLSWTTNYAAACYFACVSTPGSEAPEGLVLRREIRKNSILYYVNNTRYDELIHDCGEGGEPYGNQADHFEMAAWFSRQMETQRTRGEARLPLDGFEPLAREPESQFVKYKTDSGDEDFLTNLDKIAWRNSKYRVVVDDIEDPQYTHVSICRHDGNEGVPWDDMQAIKNQLFGDDAEAVELFPAASRVVNHANVCHLWVKPDAIQFLVGWGFVE